MKIPTIAIVVTHPIQHFCPQYVSYSTNNNYFIKVFFASKAGSDMYYDPKFGKEIKWGNLCLENFNHEFLNGGQTLPITSQLDAPELEHKLEEYSPDYVFQYGYSQRLQRRAYRWAVKNNIPLLHFADSELRHVRAFRNKLLKRLYLPHFYKQISGFLTVGDANEAYYRHYGVPDRKFFRSPLPIDIKHYEVVKAGRDVYNTELRSAYNIPDDNVVCSVVGKLVHWKSQIHTISALAQLDGTLGNVSLLIIGSGEDEHILKSAANSIKHNQVIFTGFVNPIDLPKYYAATDIYIHPSFREPHSVAISEAVYMGCPVILSDYCGSYGSSDDVRQGRNGFVYTYGDINELCTYISALTKDIELRKTFSKNSEQISVSSQRLSHFEGLESAIKSLSLKK